MERWNALRQLPAVLGIIWQAGHGLVIASATGRIAGALVPLATLLIAKRIIDTLASSLSHKQALSFDLWLLVAAEFSLAVLGAILGRATHFSDSLLADRFTRHVSLRVMEHASRLDLTLYEDPAFSDVLERARVQATDRVGLLFGIGRILQEGVVAITLAASIFLFSPWLLLLLVICVAPAFLGESHFAFLGYSLNFRQTPVRRELDYLRTLGASKEAAKELKLFGLSSFFIDRYTTLSDQLISENIALAKRRFRAGSLLSMVSTAGYYGAYAYVIYRTATGGLSIGTFAFLAGAIAGASANIQSIFSQISNIADQALFVTDLLVFFKVRPTVKSNPGALPAPRPIRKGFEFRDVSFTYPGSSRLILDGLSFSIEPGQRIALLGANGQGKTTIVKLLTRLYDPTGGRILLDGCDLRDYDLEDLSRELGVIFQDFMRYEMTAQDNIAVGKIEAREQFSEIKSAAHKSMASEVIRKLPEGYQQQLGRRFEGGVDLSGGEWQKLALARAYLRDAQLLVLDEPTASLDARSEYEIFQRFADLTNGKMALLISHRFSTVRMVDTILVLADGKIAEIGDHQELMARSGLYSEMFELQASSYR